MERRNLKFATHIYHFFQIEIGYRILLPISLPPFLEDKSTEIWNLPLKSIFHLDQFWCINGTPKFEICRSHLSPLQYLPISHLSYIFPPNSSFYFASNSKREKNRQMVMWVQMQRIAKSAELSTYFPFRQNISPIEAFSRRHAFLLFLILLLILLLSFLFFFDPYQFLRRYGNHTGITTPFTYYDMHDFG